MIQPYDPNPLKGALDSDYLKFPIVFDGSAKAALIAIGKSISAWQKLYELRESAEDVGLNCLSLLSTIKRKALTEFPKAIEFVRPGFDE